MLKLLRMNLNLISLINLFILSLDGHNLLLVFMHFENTIDEKRDRILTINMRLINHKGKRQQEK